MSAETAPARSTIRKGSRSKGGAMGPPRVKHCKVRARHQKAMRQANRGPRVGNGPGKRKFASAQPACRQSAALPMAHVAGRAAPEIPAQARPGQIVKLCDAVHGGVEPGRRLPTKQAPRARRVREARPQDSKPTAAAGLVLPAATLGRLHAPHQR